MKIAIVNGPNLDRLGKREPEVYGHQSLADLEKMLRTEAARLGVGVVFFQSNHEGALIDFFASESGAGVDGFIVNLGAFTHTSLALRDCLAGTGKPIVEVHISNIHAREAFREKSLTGAVARGVITGLGFYGYVAALGYLAN